MADTTSRADLREVVLGVDLGTTSTKVVAFDTSGAVLASHSAGYPLLEPFPGQAVQDPAQIVAAALEGITAVTAAVVAVGGQVAAMSFSTAMHSLLAVDARGTALTPVVTWADTRAQEQADALHATPAGLALHRRTGTPVHPMSPLVKLLWFRAHDAATYDAAALWVGIKEVLVHALTGRWVTDHSTASATGLLELATLDWDAGALALTGVRREQLPVLTASTDASLRLLPAVAGRLGLDSSLPVVLGGGDGPLANLGVGAVRPGVAACSIGTSGALRVTVTRPTVDPRGQVFCYALVPGLWVVGGAVTNGGVVLGWAGDALAPDLEQLAGEPEQALLALAEQAPPGSGGLVMLPYLLSERAPHWSSLPRGVYVGLTRAHRREHLVRAALEGVCQQLALVLASLREAGHEVTEVRATGGFARSPFWSQLLADVLGLPVGFARGHEGSGFGAALVGMVAVGLVPSVGVAEQVVTVDHVLVPDPERAALYADLRRLHAAAYDALLPVFGALRDLAPRLPVDLGHDPAEPVRRTVHPY